LSEVVFAKGQKTMNADINSRFNILDKLDKSLIKSSNGAVTRKVDRYEWNIDRKLGQFRLISKFQLNIDGRYQRDQVSTKKVMDIASGWDWLLIGTISVIERQDSTFWVFDGGHRTRAAFRRDDIDELPCIVHKLENVNEEAKAFVERNTMVSNVSAFDRFNASVVAEEPIAKSTLEMLTEFGLKPVKGGAQSGDFISCIGALQECVKINHEDAKKTLALCLKIAGDQIVTGRVLLGMFTLHQHFKPSFDVIDRFREKLERHSQRELEVKINQFRAECGKGGNVISAKAILELINHRLKTKIQW
jgi:hypothetical protein